MMRIQQHIASSLRFFARLSESNNSDRKPAPYQHGNPRPLSRNRPKKPFHRNRKPLFA